MPVTLLNYLDGRGYFFNATVQNNIPYIEFPKYDEVWARDQNTVTRYLACLWQQRRQFRIDMLGTSKRVLNANFAGQLSNLHRIPPEQHPEEPTLYASDCRLIEPMGVPPVNDVDLAKALSSGADYNFALDPMGDEVGDTNMRDTNTRLVKFAIAYYAVTYTTRDYWIQSDTDQITQTAQINQVPGNQFNPPQNPGELGRYVSRYPSSSAENQKIPGTGFTYQSGGFVAEPIAKTFFTKEIHYVWHEVPIVPWQAIEATVGKCNQSIFDPLYGNYPAQTLICLSPQYRPYFNAAGDYVWDIEYIFIFKRWTHNAIFTKSVGFGGQVPGNLAESQVGAPGFEIIVPSGNIISQVTPTADFNALFILP